jgi:hypothetical protein
MIMANFLESCDEYDAHAGAGALTRPAERSSAQRFLFLRSPAAIVISWSKATRNLLFFALRNGNS